MPNSNTLTERPPVNPPEIAEESRKSYTSPLIELFELDLTPVGLGIFGFTNSYKEDGQPIYFNGRQYFAIPIQAEGFEYKGDGGLPTPTLTLSTVNKVTAAMIINNRDLVGCTVTRIKTFERFLDDGETPNPAARFQDEVYRINRRKTLNQYQASFELTNVIDFENKQLPKNQVIKTYCTYIYRRYVNGQFYIDPYFPCPYAGSACFDENNNPCEASKDKCNKQLSGCEARYGNDVLPFQGFPSVPKV